jgi:hypothetical protein
MPGLSAFRQATVIALAALAAASAANTQSTARVQPAAMAISDAPAEPAARLAVSHMLAQGIMQLRAPSRFAPQEPVTVGEYLVSMQRLFALTASPRQVRFSDVPPGSPYYQAAQAVGPYLGRQMLCFGCALSTRLLPDQPITNELATVTLVGVLHSRNALQLIEPGRAETLMAPASQAHQLSPQARIYLATAMAAGITQPTSITAAERARGPSRAELALTFDRVQARFNLPQAHSPNP